MNGEQVRVLVVDDEESIRKLLKRILEGYGYSVVTAVDGVEALYKLALEETKVMLLDIKMPKMSGIEVLHKLSGDWPDFCIIMVTAIADLSTAVDTLKLGAFDYITKPFDRDEVKEKVQKSIEKWQRLLKEKHNYRQLQESITSQTKRMQSQFVELVNSLAREHTLLQQLAAKEGKAADLILSRLPPELREPISSAEKFRDALLRILKGA